jgi:hypothetical protein
MRTVYYLTHGENQRRLRYYTTLSGARIAQRQRNRRLGFHTRLERVEVGNLEYERCLLSDHQIVDATWVIEEDTLESPDLIVEAP